MRKVAHPDKLFIQINDEDERTLGFSFNDDETNPEGLDPNVLDDDTLLRRRCWRIRLCASSCCARRAR